jgi:hypothetical protein
MVNHDDVVAAERRTATGDETRSSPAQAVYPTHFRTNPKFDVFRKPSQRVLDLGRAMRAASEKLGLFGR